MSYVFLIFTNFFKLKLNLQVEIGHEGSGVFVSRAQWETANSRNSFQNMAVSLVSSLFENEVLLASNLRGGKSRIDKNAQRKPGLDATIISAITGELLFLYYT